MAAFASYAPRRKNGLTFCREGGIMERNRIGQFVTILSVNKTRDFLMGAMRPFLLTWARTAPIFS